MKWLDSILNFLSKIRCRCRSGCGGEIDYRFAVEAMHNANYDGFMSIEGVFGGDQYYSDKISLEYCKNLWTVCCYWSCDWNYICC